MTSSNRPFLLHPFPTFRPLSKAGHTLRHALCRGVWAGGRKVGGDAGRGDGPAAWRRGVRRRAAPGATGSQAVPERMGCARAPTAGRQEVARRTRSPLPPSSPYAPMLVGGICGLPPSLSSIQRIHARDSRAGLGNPLLLSRDSRHAARTKRAASHRTSCYGLPDLPDQVNRRNPRQQQPQQQRPHTDSPRAVNIATTTAEVRKWSEQRK